MISFTSPALIIIIPYSYFSSVSLELKWQSPETLSKYYHYTCHLVTQGCTGRARQKAYVSLRLNFPMALGNSNQKAVRMKHSSALVCVSSNLTFSQATQLDFTKIYPEGKGKRKAVRSSWDIMLYISLFLT